MGVRGVQWGVLLGTVCVAVQPTLGSSSSCVDQRAPISPGLPAHCGTPPIDLGAYVDDDDLQFFPLGPSGKCACYLQDP